MEEIIQVSVREGRGTQAAKHLRRDGQIPAILYGHGEENVALAVPAAAFEAALRHGSRVVELEGGIKEKAMISDVQWDTFGADVLHIDFTRVSASEVVTATVAIELRGDAPGLKEGGIVELLVHEVEIQLPASQIVDHLELTVNNLHLDQSLTGEDLELPPGGKLEDPTVVLAHCVTPMVVEEPTEEEVSEEPEVIGQDEEEENEGE